MDFNQTIILMQQGQVDAAVQSFYDVLLADDNACYHIPLELSGNSVFINTLTDRFNDMWDKAWLGGIHSRIMLLNNYIQQKRWRDIQNDDGIKYKLSALKNEAPNDQELAVAYMNYYYLAGYYLSAMMFVKRIERYYVEHASESTVLVKLNCMLELGWYDMVEEFFCNLHEEQRTADILCYEAMWARQNADYLRGVKAAREALVINSNDVRALFELGANLFFGGDVKAAEKGCFEPLLAMSQYDQTAQYYACFVHIYLGEKDKALEQVGDVLLQSTPLSYYTAAEVFALLEDYDMASECLEKAESLGFVSYRCMWDDCAFRGFRETERGEALMTRIYGKLYRDDLLLSLQIDANHKWGEVVAHAVPARRVYAMPCIMSHEVETAVLSTGSNYTVVDRIRYAKSMDIGMDRMMDMDATPSIKCYVPTVGGTVPVDRVSFPFPRIKDRSAYALEGWLMMSRAMSIPGGALVGLDRIGNIGNVILESANADEPSESHTVDFRYDYGFYVVKASLVGPVAYNTDEAEVAFVVDTTSSISYISRQQYNIINEDGSFPSDPKLFGKQWWNVVRCPMRLDDYLINKVELVIVEDNVYGHIGYDILSKFRRVKISNNSMKITFEV